MKEPVTSLALEDPEKLPGMGAGVLNINIGVSPAGEILMLLSESTQTVYMTPKAAAAVVQGLQDAILKSQALEADTPQ